GLENLEAVDKFENNCIQSEDQFQGSIVQSVDIGVKNNGGDGIILVSKMVYDEKEDKESDDLPESNREIIWNTEYAEKDEIVMTEVISECLNVAKAIDNEIADRLFNPGGSIYLNILLIS
ncbi:23790_t:CDS:1, partial [Gigaspora rosea]